MKTDIFHLILQMTCTILQALVGSTMLKLSNGFANPLPSAVCIISYAISYYCFSLALRKIPLAVGYAIWSGCSTVGNTIIGCFCFQEDLSLIKVVTLGAIILGTILINNGKAEELIA